MGRAWFRARSAVVVTVAICIGASLLVEAVDLDPSVGNRRFHSSLETADALVLVFIAAVILGRLRSDRSSRNVLMLGAAVVLAAKNLVFALVTMAVFPITGEHWIVWSTAISGAIGAGGLAAAAVLPDRRIRRSHRTVALVLGTAVGIVMTVLALTIALELLPPAFDQIPEDAEELAFLSGHPVKILIDMATALGYFVAAVAFARIADDRGDEFLKWLSIGCVVASVAFLNYAMFPSRFTDFLYGGELLWIGAVVALAYGAVREIANLEAALIRSAVREERRRVARDLHDGVVQELSYISTQARALVSRQPSEPRYHQPLVRIVDAVDRALDESRGAIAALNREMDEPLDHAIGHAASDVANRVDVQLRLDLAPHVEVPAEWRDALIRIAREAVGNAARHGRARQIGLQLIDGDIVRLRITDDGDGFDVDAPRSALSFGLQSMRERAESLGGNFRIRSAPGHGTTIEVSLRESAGPERDH